MGDNQEPVIFNGQEWELVQETITWNPRFGGLPPILPSSVINLADCLATYGPGVAHYHDGEGHVVTLSNDSDAAQREDDHA